jgi:hypothetical protein
MTHWVQHFWYGPVPAAEAALRALGWHAPDEAPRPMDPRIGGMVPPPGTALFTLDGDAMLAIVARETLPVPEGLSADRPQLGARLLGSF